MFIFSNLHCFILHFSKAPHQPLCCEQCPCMLWVASAVLASDTASHRLKHPQEPGSKLAWARCGGPSARLCNSMLHLATSAGERVDSSIGTSCESWMHVIGGKSGAGGGHGTSLSREPATGSEHACYCCGLPLHDGLLCLNAWLPICGQLCCRDVMSAPQAGVVRGSARRLAEAE